MYAQLLNDILTNILYKLCRCWYRPTHPELHKGTYPWYVFVLFHRFCSKENQTRKTTCVRWDLQVAQNQVNDSFL